MAKKTAKIPSKVWQSKFKYIKWFWILFFSGIVGVISLFLLASLGAFGTMPKFEELENPENKLATEIISSDGKTLGTIYNPNENRTPVAYDRLPKHLVKALVATEDERFYTHAGIDARGTLRAVANLGRKGGASTISQQLAKLLFTGGSQNIVKRVLQKLKEWVIAIRLERQYTKDEIITMYFNKQDFLYQAIGIGSAARIYFGKQIEDLDLQESAILVAMLKNPRQYNPHRERSKQKSLSRRNQVFKQMERAGYLTTKEKDSLQKLPLKINFSPEGHADGVATYFRAYLKSFMSKWAKENPKQDPISGATSYYDVYQDGLKIYVTIDSRMQRYAEEAVKEHLTKLQAEFNRQNKDHKLLFQDVEPKAKVRNIKQSMKRSERYRVMKAKGISDKKIFASFDKKQQMKIFTWKGLVDTLMTPKDSILHHKSYFQTGMMSMDPQTGHVKAWVGGNDYNYFKYDHVKQGKRQVGSTFKPFVYATAIDQLKKSPCDTLPNVQYTIPAGHLGAMEDWTPKNSGNKYGGYLSLKEALANSVNTITAQLMGQVGPVPVVKLVKKMGVQSKIIEVPSIALGTVDLSVYEMVGAYSTFANKGVYNTPVMITRIEDKNGTTLYQNIPDPKDVISEEAAYVTINLMEGVTQSGSGSRLRSNYSRSDFKKVITGYPYEFKNPIAGKTGTTQNQSDGWFMGVVPNLCTGVWVGAEDRSTHFPSVVYGQGAAMALPIWALYMKKCYADKSLKISKEAFEAPEELSITIDCKAHNANENEEHQDHEGVDEFDF